MLEVNIWVHNLLRNSVFLASGHYSTEETAQVSATV